MEITNSVIGNLVWENNIKDTHLYEDGPFWSILEASASAIFSAENRLKVYTPGKLIFGCDTILLIKYMADWEIICHRKQLQMDNYKIVDYEFKARDKLIPNNEAV